MGILLVAQKIILPATSVTSHFPGTYRSDCTFVNSTTIFFVLEDNTLNVELPRCESLGTISHMQLCKIDSLFSQAE